MGTPTRSVLAIILFVSLTQALHLGSTSALHFNADKELAALK